MSNIEQDIGVLRCSDLTTRIVKDEPKQHPLEVRFNHSFLPSPSTIEVCYCQQSKAEKNR